MIRKLDGVGRLTIPMEIRSKLRWEEKDEIRLEIKDSSLVLTKQKKVCSICGINHILISIEDGGICEACLKKLEENR